MEIPTTYGNEPPTPDVINTSISKRNNLDILSNKTGNQDLMPQTGKDQQQSLSSNNPSQTSQTR